MTKSSKSRIASKAGARKIAAEALTISGFGRHIEVEGVKFVAMPESAYVAVVSALKALSE